MTGRVVRGRSRVLLSDSSSDEEYGNIDVVVKHMVAEDNVAAPSGVAPHGIDSMFLEDEIQDDDISDEPPPVAIFFHADIVRSFPQENNMNNFEGGGWGESSSSAPSEPRVRPEWLDSFVREMEGSQPGFSTFRVEKQVELALAQSLTNDGFH